MHRGLDDAFGGALRAAGAPQTVSAPEAEAEAEALQRNWYPSECGETPLHIASP